jgi:beta-aspartyl-peptidase (threonine type)
MVRYGAIVHGGAWDIPDELAADHVKGVKAALEKAHSIVSSGGHAIDAVDAAVSLMEDDPTFDAGRGSFVNNLGEVEMDAIIATSDHRLGSVCAVQNIKNPIKLARLVMERTKHVMLAGSGANLFAREQGVAECRPEDLLVGRELERYYEIKKMKGFEPKDAFRPSRAKRNGMGTVGCVCLDKCGGVAIGVSTGGTPYKRAGRVGDTPIFGCGGYVEPIGGAAATGFGEDLIKILASREVVDDVRRSGDPVWACRHTIELLGSEVGGLGGVIFLGPAGFGLAFNTPRMAFAVGIDGERPVVGIDQGSLSKLR